MSLSKPPSTDPERITPDTTGAAAIGARVLGTEAEALATMAGMLGADFEAAVAAILRVRGRVIVSGMGKSGHIGRKIAATLASTGTPATFVHPGEASHGDLGMIVPDDLCLVLSNSGETAELADVIAHTRRFSIPLVSISRDPASTLARQSDIALLLPDTPEACAIGMAPTTSTTATLALGDALAVAVMEARGFDRAGFLAFHPGGKLGAQLMTVGALMHTGPGLPMVGPGTAMGETLVTMTSAGFGIAAVVEDARLIGVVTDGDLRRNLEGLMSRTAGEIATRDPVTIQPDALASEALGLMNRTRIGALMVTDADGRLAGLIHIHDCLRAGVG